MTACIAALSAPWCAEGRGAAREVLQGVVGYEDITHAPGELRSGGGDPKSGREPPQKSWVAAGSAAAMASMEGPPGIDAMPCASVAIADCAE